MVCVRVCTRAWHILATIHTRVYCPHVWYITCSDNVGQFDAVWDRGSMVAVNVGDRERWVTRTSGS